ncbi:succinyl-diaminopimelate desuccinylase [Spinactinospora alkalitolerans]|uniref:Probable succinyl-diaminopimelate desuccinylase n=1 Tax=Spinactinospora alkalitolerans TaxID=687207 RepID=A0A852TVS1_9ACTN|nr:M20 family metallopeptidase [Spinactinospora alkalitolerans]NYE46933.1 succinyl-diaminopimelate desuccinylase [Spinactinospora alkalitolerans]
MTTAPSRPSRRFPIDAEGVVEFTRRLVRVRSVHDPERGTAEAEAAALVEAKMREFGWEPVVTEVAPGRPNVVAVVEGGGGPGPTLAFEGHTDVVTEGGSAEWSVDPFGGEIRDGRLYGRGAADMKSGVAAMLYAVHALHRAGPFPGRVAVCALVDEEGMMIGAKHFAASRQASGIDGAVICEPEEGEICVVAKGAIRIRTDFTGTMAHGAMPQHGRNPLAAVGRLLVALERYQQELWAEHGAHEHLGRVYLTPTVADAGSAQQINVIPASATVCVDVRTVPGVDHQALVERVARLAREAAEPESVTARTGVVDDRPAVAVDPDSPLVTALAAAHEAVTGEAARYGGVPGATDGTILTRDAGIPTVVYGPGGKWIAHQADEFVEVDDIVRCAHVYAEAAERFLTGGAR